MITLHAGIERARPFLLFEAERHERLAADLRGIADGTAPTKDVLDAAPVADRWALAKRPVPTIVGLTVGHPRLPDGPIFTTDVIAIDLVGGWARTLSRFYVLGQRLGDADV